MRTRAPPLQGRNVPLFPCRIEVYNAVQLRTLLPLALSLVLATGTSQTTAQATQAAANPYERGPAPTVASIEASRGPFAVSETTVSSLVGGFGGGTIYYPTSTASGTFGAVAISPGYTGTQATISWLGPRLASQGFVVITIDTNSIFDQPDSRASQLLAALDYVTQQSTVRTRVDATRLGVMGHSMGGGGSLRAASQRLASACSRLSRTRSCRARR